MIKAYVFIFCMAGVFALVWGVNSFSQEPEEIEVSLSDQTEECLECHRIYTPGIVEDWLISKHSQASPGNAQKKSELERALSSETVPQDLLDVAVGCCECHSLNVSQHTDRFEHFENEINVVVSPQDCATCHEREAGQYLPSKKAHAYFNLENNSIYHTLVETVTSIQEVQDGKILSLGSSVNAQSETCYACHGTLVEVKGLEALDTELGEIQVPDLSGWPNQGVGRVNPDGTSGACTACHPRHSFSIEVARKADTCSQCHLEPDLPAWNVYRESKHGNIFYSKQDDWNWDHLPWVVGTDFNAPTCATCHNSLLVSSEGDVIAERSHDFGARLWVRIFGLIYSHPQPRNGQTFLIRNQDGLPLPTTFSGDLASDYLLGQDEQENRQEKMKKVCLGCHGPTWTSGHFKRFHTTLKEADKMVEVATRLMIAAWKCKIADRTNLFDESLEQKWLLQWLFYANSLRYASAMMGPDYAAFKNGWWALTKNLQEMKDYIGLKTALKKE
jgi:hypothetical protein